MKEKYTEKRIISWYEHWHGQVYISFSGGKDSTVLLDQVRKIYPDVPAVFVNTGLEYKEIIDFVKTVNNVVWIKPTMTFWQIVEKYGWPVVSKQVSMGLSRYRCTKSELQKELRLHGGINPTSGKKQQRTIPIKLHYLIDAPFKCSEQCCNVMKKKPLKTYARESGRKAFTGMMAGESSMRRVMYLKSGCNSFDQATPISSPMAFWKEEDVWEYIKKYELPYSSIYDKGEERTGCKYCMFGAHMESEPNRFQRMRARSPGQFKNLEAHGGCEVLDELGVAYR
jgi:3'-phosphoadenosine 5'-phosphosulfate sulfotransferase (PAPS reductase)/FAD synthetase